MLLLLLYPCCPMSLANSPQHEHQISFRMPSACWPFAYIFKATIYTWPWLATLTGQHSRENVYQNVQMWMHLTGHQLHEQTLPGASAASTYDTLTTILRRLPQHLQSTPMIDMSYQVVLSILKGCG